MPQGVEVRVLSPAHTWKKPGLSWLFLCVLSLREVDSKPDCARLKVKRINLANWGTETVSFESSLRHKFSSGKLVGKSCWEQVLPAFRSEFG